MQKKKYGQMPGRLFGKQFNVDESLPLGETTNEI
jgi:hypothetical protein